jgi:hypothetical protein
MAAYSVAITCSVGAQSESKFMLLKSAPHKVATSNSSSIPSPQSGIKLIEYISQRMHTLKSPVIAAKSATYAQQMLQEKSQGPTNQLLAIKPPTNTYNGPRELDRESAADKNSNEELKKRKSDESRSDKKSSADDASSGSYTNSSSSARRAILASAPTGSSKKESQATARDREAQSAAFGRIASGPLAKSLANLNGALQGVDNLQRIAEGGKEVKARAKGPRAEASYQDAGKPAPGVWERGQMLQTQQGFGYSSNNKDARLASSAGAAGGGAGAATDAVVPEPKAPPMPPSYYRTNFNRLPSSGKNIGMAGDQQYISTAAGGAVTVRDYRQAPTTIASASLPAAAPAMAPAQQSPFMPPPVLTDGPANAHFNNINNSLKQKTEIALLPPNVITGIPLVRLGSSAIDANRALTSVKGNKLKQQSINGWTVYVLHKANSPEPAMQVYVRHGLVEALRIFDNAFIAPDFGVQLNDDVSLVKAKFGEPAFMQDEPECPAAKNYVYPISQVSFELTRPANSPSPKVVSVLIFTVK